MKKIRCKKDVQMCVSVKDVFNYLKEELDLTDKQKKYAQWRFTQSIYKNLYNEYKRGSSSLCILILEGHDVFITWAYWGFAKTYLPKTNKWSRLLEVIDNPQEIQHSDLFQIIE